MLEQLKERLLAQKLKRQQQDQLAAAHEKEVLNALNTLIASGMDFEDIIKQSNHSISKAYLDRRFKQLGLEIKFNEPLANLRAEFGSRRWVETLPMLELSSGSEDDLMANDNNENTSYESYIANINCAMFSAGEMVESVASGILLQNYNLRLKIESVLNKLFLQTECLSAIQRLEVKYTQNSSVLVPFYEPVLMPTCAPNPQVLNANLQFIAANLPIIDENLNLIEKQIKNTLIKSQFKLAKRDIALKFGEYWEAKMQEYQTFLEDIEQRTLLAKQEVAQQSVNTQELMDTDPEPQPQPQPQPEPEPIESQMNDEEIALELQRVQQQVKEMEKRHLEVEESNRKKQALKAISSKRAALATARAQINMTDVSLKIARLEAQLKSEKEKMLDFAKRIESIKSQESNLNEEERVISHTNPATQHPQLQLQLQHHEISVNEPDAKTTLLDPFVSPLEMVSGYRFKPHAPYFQQQYNAEFIPNLSSRSLCPTEFSGAHCSNSKCEFVHFKDFEVDNQTVLKYMCLRDFDNLEYKQHLITYLSALQSEQPTLNVNQLADHIAKARLAFFGGFLNR